MSRDARLEVNLEADCAKYAAPLTGFVMIGVLHRGTRVEGALAFNTAAQVYVRVNGAAIEALNKSDVAAVRSSIASQQQLQQSA